MKLLETIPVPWTPYALTFSQDGTRLAIGGGTYIGNGGILVRHLSDGTDEQLRWVDHLDHRSLFPDVHPYLDPATGERIRIDLNKLLRVHLRLASQAGATAQDAIRALIKQFGPQLRWSGIPTISGLAFSDDGQCLAASMLSYGHRALPPAIFQVSGTHLTLKVLFTESESRDHVHTGVLFHDDHLIVRREHRYGRPMEPFAFHQLPSECNLPATRRFDHLTHSGLIVKRGAVITGAIGCPPRDAGYRLAVHGFDGTNDDQMLRQRVMAISATPGDGFVTAGRGEIDRWTWDGRWVAERIRPHQPDGAWIRAIVTTQGNRLVTSNQDGELTVDANRTWQIPAAGSPRSLAAHPTSEIVAIGLKGGGSFNPASEVALVEVD